MTRMPAHWLVFRSTLPFRATALEEKDHEINAYDRSAHLRFHHRSHGTGLHPDRRLCEFRSQVLSAAPAAADHPAEREVVLPAASSASHYPAEREVVLFAASA